MITAKDFYLIRTPLLPLDLLDQFNGLTHAALNNRLKIVFADPYLQEAIYIASPELYQEFKKWQQDHLLQEKEVDKILLSLFKYLLRMCARSTPYGLFAGCATGKPGKVSQITLDKPEQHKKHCRLDMNYVAELATMISALPEVKEQILYYPNNSIYAIGNKYRYAEYKVENKFRTYHLTEVAYSAYLEKIIKTATKGATLKALRESIVNDDISEQEAVSFVTELVQSQLLLSELEPTITGEEFFDRLIRKIKSLPITNCLAEKLIHIQKLLRDQTIGIDKYLQINLLVKELLPDTNSKDLVQTDLFLQTKQNVISSNIISGIEKQVEKLWALSRLNENTDLKNFTERFNTRYEGQEIPLVIALDAEAGIGYAGNTGSNADYAPLVDDIFAGKTNGSTTTVIGKFEDFQQKRLRTCLINNATEIKLTDNDLDHLKDTATPTMPDSLYLMGSILGASPAEIDKGNYEFELMACGGPSAANLLGRFCHGDHSLAAKVKDCLREEEHCNPNEIYAEVVHLPEARTGNVLQRPQLRDYEIVYLGNGSVDANHQIPLTDLMVSIQNDTIILRSKKLNKRIIPRLSTAHNFSTGSLPAYKFLGDLQFQHLHAGIAWQWNALNEEPFLPRVSYGKIILSKCTWTLHKKDYAELTAKKETEKSGYPALAERIRTQLRLPQYIVIVENDNELLIDLDSESCVYILINTLIKKEKIVLQEFLKTRDKCFVEGDSGKHTNEIIIPLKNTHENKIVHTDDKKFLNTDPQIIRHVAKNEWNNTTPLTPERSFITGSEWLYIKIYCGTNSAEKILTDMIRPLTERLIEADKIDKWFFIRYADPENHLRIRFHHSTDKDFWKTVLEELHSGLQGDTFSAMAYRIQTDTYEREIERYGIDTVCLSEDVFYYDSEAVINCIDLLEGEEGERYRWLLAARGVNMLLEAFGYGLNSKAAILKKLQQGYFSEFGGDKVLSNQLNDKYRENMREIGSFLNPDNDAKNEIEEAIALFTIRSEKIKNPVVKIKEIQQRESATPDMDKLLTSYIHIFLNRMLISNQRKHELVIYHFLNKYCDSQIAIKKKQLQIV